LSKNSSIDLRRKGISYHVLYLTVVDVFKQTLDAARNTAKLSRETKRKLTKASPHWLRHCFASLSLNHGLSVHTLSKLLGHRDEATTALYAKDEDAELERQQLEAFAKGRDRMDSLYRARGQ
jgi:site-specific recombinase XerD